MARRLALWNGNQKTSNEKGIRAASLSGRMPFALQPHHARPFRRRHIAAASLALFAVFLSGIAGFEYMYNQYARRVGASVAVHEQAEGVVAAAKSETVRSSLGFHVSYDPDLLAVSATEHAGQGKSAVYDGAATSQVRAYAQVKFVQRPEGRAAPYDRSSLTFTVANQRSSTEQLPSIANAYVPTTTAYARTLKAETVETMAGVSFLKQTYTYAPKFPNRGKIVFEPTEAYVYVGLLPSGRPLVVVIDAASPSVSPLSAYANVLSSLQFSGSDNAKLTPVSSVVLPQSPLAQVSSAFGISGRVAAATPGLMDSARIVATNAPAVVKIYHLTCGIIVYRDQELTNNGCDASSGTGFFVSHDGYIATNGHVASTSAQESVANIFSPEVISRMLEIDGYNSYEVASIVQDIKTSTTTQATILQAIAKLTDAEMHYQQKQDQYIIALGKEAPDLNAIADKRSFTESAHLRVGELIAIDYDAKDMQNTSGFTKSDVAVLRVKGDNFPYVHLGSLAGLEQGSGVTVIGYPSEAENNALVKSENLQSTATRGIVSAIREVKGTNLKVVQSDVRIGHGNSGGPAFDTSGKVFGLVTYVLAGAQNGDAGVTYIRDVQDLKNVLGAHGISLSAAGSVQQEWEQGLRDFYAAHYSRAIVSFERVHARYPSHVLAEQYIGIARAKIVNGEEAANPLTAAVIASAFIVSVAALVWAITLIVRHRAHHHVYRAVRAGYVRGAFPAMQHVSHGHHR